MADQAAQAQAADQLFTFDPAAHRTIPLVQLEPDGSITQRRGRRLSSDVLDALTYGQDLLPTPMTAGQPYGVFHSSELGTFELHQPGERFLNPRTHRLHRYGAEFSGLAADCTTEQYGRSLRAVRDELKALHAAGWTVREQYANGLLLEAPARRRTPRFTITA